MLESGCYFKKMSGQLKDRTALILNPLLATGGGLMASIGLLKQVGGKTIEGLILGAPEGLRRLEETHPDLEI